MRSVRKFLSSMFCHCGWFSFVPCSSPACWVRGCYVAGCLLLCWQNSLPPHTRENCWSFFIERVRRQLKVKALCVCVCLFVCLSATNWYVCESSYTTTYNAHRFNYPCNLLPLTRWYCVSPLWAPPCGCVPGSSLPLWTVPTLTGSMNGQRKPSSLSAPDSSLKSTSSRSVTLHILLTPFYFLL